MPDDWLKTGATFAYTIIIYSIVFGIAIWLFTKWGERKLSGLLKDLDNDKKYVDAVMKIIDEKIQKLSDESNDENSSKPSTSDM